MGAPFSPAELRVLRKTHVFVCMPCYGGMLTEATFRSVLELSNLAVQCGIPWTLLTMANESLITRARNNLVAQTMASPEATHLLFVDADIRFPAEAPFRLVLRDKDVVGGCCPAKREPSFYVLNPLAGGKREGDLVEVTTIGTGFMLVRRRVLQRMFEAYPQAKYRDSLGLPARCEPHMYALFDTAIEEGGRYLSEDWAFCARWRNLGGEVWADRSLELGHYGAHLFAGDAAQRRAL
jgi:hypothetical protein